jgi:hypothetical protein
MKHKHADLIHAWADGAEIQYKTGGLWVDCINNSARWLECCEYRIKPEEKKPVVRWLWAYEVADEWFTTSGFFSEQEVATLECIPKDPIKLEWSRTEFPE